MTKEVELEKLFTEWQEEQTNNGIHKFCKDGIIDENIFAQEKIKVLILSNEPNDDNNDNLISDRRADFKNYSLGNEEDNWHGKMRERCAEMYKLIVDATEMSNPEAASRFAVMNLNKGGGGSNADINIIESYCQTYKAFILKELDIIEPNIIIWSGAKSFDRAGIRKALDIKKDGNKAYITIKGKKVPVIRMWHFSHYRAKGESLEEYNNKTTGKLMAKLKGELEAIGWEA